MEQAPIDEPSWMPMVRILVLVIGMNVFETWMPTTVAVPLAMLAAFAVTLLFARRVEPGFASRILRSVPFLLYVFVGINGVIYLNCRAALPLWAHGLMFAGYIFLFRWAWLVEGQEKMKMHLALWSMVSAGAGFLLALIPVEGPCTLIN